MKNLCSAIKCMSPDKPKVISADEAAGLVKSGDLIITGHSSASPRAFMQAMVKRAEDLSNVWITHVRVEGPAEYLAPCYKDSFFHNAFMLGPNSRQSMLEGRADYIPNRFGQMPVFMQEGFIKPDIVLLQLSPPDSFGYCSYGICTSYLPAAAKVAKITIGEINPLVPVTFGSRIHVSDLDYVIEATYPLYESPQVETGEVELAIGKHIASLIDDGSTLQLGIGGIPNAVLASLKNHKDIGIHSEMIGNGVCELMEAGVINGRKKAIDPCKVVCTFVMGDKRLFSFLANNPTVEFHDVSYTNDPNVIARNEKMVAINSAIEVDVTGQICAESIGTSLFTGTGGQLDFALGASIAPKGKFIIALPSTASRGKVSRIAAMLAPGAAVTTPRTLADYVVTEYGIAELRGRNLRQRTKALVDICHPDFREEVLRAAMARKDVHMG
jgi:4-hydroxybutyrate CoA-transferase